MNNLKRLLIIFFLNIITLTTIAQINTTIGKQNTIGGNKDESIGSYLATTDGGFIIGGTSSSDISTDKTDTSRGGSDFWILKLNPDLTINWQKTIGGSMTDILWDIISCNDGGYLCLGSSNSPISGEKTLSGYGAIDIWLVKIDSVGNIVWQNVYGGSGNDGAYSMIQMNNGNYIIGGESDSDSSGLKSENSRGSWDYWLVCIDSLGNFLWDKTYGGTSYERLVKIIKTSNNEIILGGMSQSPISGDKTAINYGLSDIWLIKLDSNGNKMWDKSYGGNDNDDGGLIIEKNNSFYILGSSKSGISGVKSEMSRGEYDYWLIKINDFGSIIWDKTIGGDCDDSGASILFIDNDKLLISGLSQSDISGEKNEPWIGGFYDIWVLGIDTNANLLWQKTIGGTGIDYLNQTFESGHNSYILFGSSNSGISGHKTEPCYGETDLWIVEISTNIGLKEYNENRINIFPNPSNGIINITIENQLEPINIKIYSQDGKAVYHGQLIDYFSKIDLSSYSKGIYLLELANKDFIKIEKIVLQ